MKKFVKYSGLLLMIFAIVFALNLAKSNTVSAQENENNFELVMPSPENYLCLDNPINIAIDGNKLAVYNKSDNTINLAGAIRDCIKLNFNFDDEYIIQMSLNGSDLYALSCYSSLYHIDIDTLKITQILTDKIITAIFADNEFLYTYDNAFSIIRYNKKSMQETKFTDNSKRILCTKSFFVIDNNVYSLINDGKIIVFDLKSSESKIFTNGTYRFISYIENDGKFEIIAINDTNLKRFDTNGKLNYKQDLSDVLPNIVLKFIASDSRQLAVLDNEENSVELLNYNFQTIKLFGFIGDDAEFFNAPQSIAIENDSIYIWDKGNNRVKKIEKSDSENKITLLPYDKNFIPDNFAVFGNTVYLSNKNNIIYSDTDLLTPNLINTTYNISALTVTHDKIYFCDKLTNAFYFCVKSNPNIFTKLCDAPKDVLTIKIIENSPLYVLTTDGIYLYSNFGKLEACIDFKTEKIENVTDFNIDYVGNIFVSHSENGNFKITKFSRNFRTLTRENKISLTNKHLDLENLNGFCFNINGTENIIYAIDADKNILIKHNLPFEIKQKGEFKPSEKIDFTQIKSPSDIAFATCENALFYQYNNNYNIAKPVLKNTKLMVLKPFSSKTFLFVMTENNEIGYIDALKAKYITPKLIENKTAHALHDTVNVFAFPSATKSEYIELKKDAILTIVDNVCDFNNNFWWYKISYKQGDDVKFGYVLRTRIIDYFDTDFSTKDLFAKAKAPRVGIGVNIYAFCDINSEILTNVTDGTKIKLLEELDQKNQFTMVEFNGIKGFVLTSELTKDSSLTSGQIYAIIFSAIILCITILYFIISKRIKKRSNR